MSTFCLLNGIELHKLDSYQSVQIRFMLIFARLISLFLHVSFTSLTKRRDNVIFINFKQRLF